MQLQLLNPYQSNLVTARNAREDLDIDTILAGCNQVIETINCLDYGVRNMNLVKPYFDSDSFSIDGKGIIVDEIDDYSGALDDIKVYIADEIEQIRSCAVDNFNSLQEYYNNEARNQEEFLSAQS